MYNNTNKSEQEFRKKERGIIMKKNNIITYSVDKNLDNKLYLTVQNGEVLVAVPWYYTQSQIQKIIELMKDVLEEKTI